MGHSPTNRDPRIGPPAARLDHVCRCDGDLLGEERPDGLLDEDFEDEPCPRCGGRVLEYPPPVWMVEEEDDC